jgi:flagellum-specific peptidoglycan hydrolase FlgJ
MNERTSTKTLSTFLALTAGPASLIPLGIGHAGPLTTQVPSAGQAGGIVHLAAMHQRAVSDREWTQRLLQFLDQFEGKLPPLKQMLGVSPGLPGGSMATAEGQADIEYEYCATFASYIYELTYHSFGLDSPMYGGDTFGFNVPPWANIRVLDNGTKQGYSLEQFGKATGRWHNAGVKPKPGWMLLFDFGHVEIVKEVIGNQIFMIGGNTGPKDANGHRHVARGQATVGEADIVGYVDMSPHQGAVRITVSPPVNSPQAQSGVAFAPHLGDGPAIPGAGLASFQSTTWSGALQVPGTSFLAQTSSTNPRTPKASGQVGTANGLTARQRRPIGDSAAQQRWLLKFVMAAIWTQQRYGIPASLTLAQMINEGGWFNGSTLALPPNFNPFGVKATSGYSETPLLPTKEQANDGTVYSIMAHFARFNSYNQAFAAHAKLLRSGPYAEHFHVIDGKAGSREAVDAYTRKIAKIYATSHSYAYDLIRIMDSLDLYRYNTVPVQAPVSQPGSSDPSLGPSVDQYGLPDVPVTVATGAPAVAVPLPEDDLPVTFQGDGQSIPVPGASTATLTAATTRSAARGDAQRAGAILASLDVQRFRLMLPHKVAKELHENGDFFTANAESYRQIAKLAGIHSARVVAALHWVNTHGDLNQSGILEGEPLGNTEFDTPQAALAFAAKRLHRVSEAVYGVHLGQSHLTVRQLAQAFAAYRWGSALRDASHPVTALRLPYATKGLSHDLRSLGWPKIPGAPEHGQYPHSHGALAVAYHLGYPVVV